MSTPGQFASEYVADYFPVLNGYLALRGLEVQRCVIGALGSVVGDWWDCEGVACPETSLHHLCSSFQTLLEEDYLTQRDVAVPGGNPPSDEAPSDLLGELRSPEGLGFLKRYDLIDNLTGCRYRWTQQGIRLFSTGENRG